MAFLSRTGVAALIFALGAGVAAAQARVGDSAPTFSVTDSHGQTQSLDQYKGKFVVLEWTNQGCPFTKKHYTSGNMQALQKEWTGKGVVWLTIISSSPGSQGYVTADQENAYLLKVNASPTAALLDPTGKLGHLYNAKTTPDMYVIDPKGKLIYSGAIDNRATTEPEDVKGADNYVSDALTASMAGKPVQTSSTRPYGCSVKYAE
jgi:peroxiredoxin